MLQSLLGSQQTEMVPGSRINCTLPQSPSRIPYGQIPIHKPQKLCIQCSEKTLDSKLSKPMSVSEQSENRRRKTKAVTVIPAMT